MKPGTPILAGVGLAVLVVMWRFRKPLFYWHWTPPGEK